MTTRDLSQLGSLSTPPVDERSRPTSDGQQTARSAGHAIVEQLVALGVARAYLVPGESFLDVLDGLHDSPIDAVVCRQEGGAGFMALADARLTGGVGVAMVTRGPGAANAAIAVHTAWQDCTPLLLFVGLVPVADRGRESFQEFSLEGWFGTTAKAVRVLDDPTRAASIVRDAHHLARSGRPGPVVIGLPEEVIRQACDEPVQPARTLPSGAAASAVTEAASLLSKAARPLVVVSGDRVDAAVSGSLRSFVEAWQLPVVTDFRAHDKLDHDSPSWCGALGYGRCDSAAGLLADADVVVHLDSVRGDVLSDGYTLGAPDAQVVVVGTDPSLVGHEGPVAVHVLATPGDALQTLAQHTPPVDPRWAERTRAARAAYVSWATPHPDVAEGRDAVEQGSGERGDVEGADVSRTRVDRGGSDRAGSDHAGSERAGSERAGVDVGAVMAALVERLEAAGERDAVVTYGAGNHAIWAQRYLPSHACPSVLAPRNGAMGFGVPAAVAAALIQPERRVVTVAGDGCFLMNGQELAVASARGARLLAIVVDNGQFGTIRAHQEAQYPGRVSGTQLDNPDFAALARGYGGQGWTATTTEQALSVLDEALAYDGVALVHLVVDRSVLVPAD